MMQTARVNPISKTLRCIASAALAVVFPPRCPLCDALSTHHDRPCLRCGSALRTDLADFTSLSLQHPAFTRARSCFLYEGVLAEAVCAFKYRRSVHLADFFVLSLLRELPHFPLADMLMPMPLHWCRLWKRGYNQSAILARLLARVSGIPCVHALKRYQHEGVQAGSDAATRLQQVRGAFGISSDAARRVRGRSIVLIDDVISTGATAHVAARTLLQAGAVRVDVLTVARPIVV